MKINYLLGMIVILGIVVFGCSQQSGINIPVNNPSSEGKSAETQENSVSMEQCKDLEGKEADSNQLTAKEKSLKEKCEMLERKSAEGKEPVMKEDGNIKILAGTKSKYYRFDKSLYEKSLQEGKIVFLDFHANWCPICKAEQPNIFAAFNELNNENNVGYEVHYNDDETNSDDNEMAKKFGITYQHTKVFLDKNGKVALKSLDVFSKDKIINEISKLI